MNDSNLFSLGDALRNMLKKRGLEDSINEHRIRETWKKTVGEYCSKFTESVRFSKGELSVKISSAIVKQELLYTRSEIISKMNELLGTELVKTLRIY